jgi:hypothetical protein
VYIQFAEKAQQETRKETHCGELTVSTSPDCNTQKHWSYAHPEMWGSSGNVGRHVEEEAADTLADLPVITPSSSRSPYGSPKLCSFDSILYSCQRNEVRVRACMFFVWMYTYVVVRCLLEMYLRMCNHVCVCMYVCSKQAFVWDAFCQIAECMHAYMHACVRTFQAIVGMHI